MSEKTVDPVNAPILTILKEQGRLPLGLHANKQWFEDPRHLMFSMARYKFVAKMLSGSKNVLEIGCGDGFCGRLVRQEVAALTLVDIDPLFVADARERRSPEWNYDAFTHDILTGPVPGSFDGIYTLDVLEHIPEEREGVFLSNTVASLAPNGVLIVGMPSKEALIYAKPISVTGHINCKTQPDLKALLLRYFTNVFTFSMNDELVHTGYAKLAHYVFALCCGPKKTA
jgi:2-polyprenyl-3-methyl-5-hydroxy-6-metoxy-1,4-benzoquinol methylase